MGFKGIGLLVQSRELELGNTEIIGSGTLGGARTHDLSLRRAALYPSELQAQNIIWCRR